MRRWVQWPKYCMVSPAHWASSIALDQPRHNAVHTLDLIIMRNEKKLSEIHVGETVSNYALIQFKNVHQVTQYGISLDNKQWHRQGLRGVHKRNINKMTHKIRKGIGESPFRKANHNLNVCRKIGLYLECWWKVGIWTCLTLENTWERITHITCQMLTGEREKI